MKLERRTWPLDGAWTFPPVLAVSLVLLTFAAQEAAAFTPLAAAAAGALFVFRSRMWTLLALAGLVLGAGLKPVATWSIYAGMPALLLAGSLFLSPHALSLLIRVPRPVWPLSILIGTSCLVAALLIPGPAAAFLVIPVDLCAALLGAGLARYLALANARILTWGEDGLEATTRNLLLGRITSGMLHDLAQPLNVISMANGNLGYIVEHLDIADKHRTQLNERIRRIATNTENTAHVLSLFRWFGRDGNPDQSLPSIRTALEGAIAATKSNVRHADVTIDLQGDALDYPLAGQHGAIEMMAVAALLSAFAGFILPDRSKIGGAVLLTAMLTSADIVITVRCTDLTGHPIRCDMDPATLWLVEQVAHEHGCVFQRMWRRQAAICYVIRIARDESL
ncbi:MAG TPA: hypothetical protein VNS79_15780 [Sphingobium sp.]|nr:hypothetical protein [Sphingobium sp.]